ncbi:GntR family transcriptional regulator [Mogibacterium pumilum]|uniref:GntR family transcriptional regulator n=1 Tax=Mogibacterium pumilum TaxID=86332 RepID=A0A223ARL3_9FIRM|nr:GntR family transcriptional regulator [Mogibacterium pumilum]ASS37572.1 GntR family transcriptional regulator [Mogibacterium pumilum]
MEWKFIDSIPIYSQIVNELTVRIARHDYLPGQKLPSVRDIAAQACVNPNTVQRALTELERSGLVRTERTNGRFVTEDEKVLKEIYKSLSSAYINEMIEKLRNIGMNDTEIMEAISSCVGKEK